MEAICRSACHRVMLVALSAVSPSRTDNRCAHAGTRQPITPDALMASLRTTDTTGSLQWRRSDQRPRHHHERRACGQHVLGRCDYWMLRTTGCWKDLRAVVDGRRVGWYAGSEVIPEPRNRGKSVGARMRPPLFSSEPLRSERISRRSALALHGSRTPQDAESNQISNLFLCDE